MMRLFAVLAVLIPTAAAAHDGALAHLHPHGIAEAWVMGLALLGGAGAFAVAMVRERRK